MNQIQYLKIMIGFFYIMLFMQANIFYYALLYEPKIVYYSYNRHKIIHNNMSLKHFLK